ncbi:SDR family oxidoreductase [Paenibacillus gansuensis]|uniref:SDR family oxidoreductase n=1 Tax=Paenibacillus gansuensis TaxID=306542 RepID=A0ABW5PBH2_9BACL
MNLKRLQGKVAFITGSGSGIGKAAALRLAEEGAKIGLIDLKGDNVNKVKRQIEEAGGEAIALDVDVSDPVQVKQAVKEVIGTWGKLDIVFANAGINGTLAPIEDMEMEDWSKTISIDLTGTFLTVKYAIPHLKENGGSIIITSSINGNRVFSGFGMSAYSTAKAGQVAFMQMAALELAQYKIRVNAICPGAISTHIDQSTKRTPELDKIEIPIEFPKGGSQPLEDGPGSPKQVANLVLFLASEESNHITGTPIYIDGAESLLR